MCTHGCCFGDLDGEGDLDFYGTTWGRDPFKLCRNNQDDENYLNVRITGTKTNTSGIGAQLWVYDLEDNGVRGRLRSYREVLGGGSMYNCPPLEQHFGLPAGRTYRLEVLFPVSGRTVRRDVTAGRTVHGEEPG